MSPVLLIFIFILLQIAFSFRDYLPPIVHFIWFALGVCWVRIKNGCWWVVEKVWILIQNCWKFICSCYNCLLYCILWLGKELRSKRGRIVCAVMAFLCQGVSVYAIVQAGIEYKAAREDGSFQVYQYVGEQPLYCALIQCAIFFIYSGILFFIHHAYKPTWMNRYQRHVLALARLNSKFSFQIVCGMISLKFQSGEYDLSFKNASIGFIAFLYSLTFLSLAVLDDDELGVIEMFTAVVVGFGLHFNSGALRGVTISVILFPKLLILFVCEVCKIHEIGLLASQGIPPAEIPPTVSPTVSRINVVTEVTREAMPLSSGGRGR